MTLENNERYFCNFPVKIGNIEFKFWINESVWSTSSDFKESFDSFGNKNNIMIVSSAKLVHTNLVKLRKNFSELKRKLGSFYSKMQIEQISDDVCVIKRYSNSFESSYVLIVRMSYDKNAKPTNIDYDLPGWLYQVKNLYYFDKQYEFISEEIPRIKCKIFETNDFNEFGYFTHQFFKKRKQSK